MTNFGKWLLFFPFDRHIKQLESVIDQIVLNFLIKRGVRTKRRQVVTLDQPRLHILRDHDVETQNLIGHRVFQIVRLATPEGMGEAWLCRYDSLDSDVFYLAHHSIWTEVGLVGFPMLHN